MSPHFHSNQLNFKFLKPSLAQRPSIKICHRLQTSASGVDEAVERAELYEVYRKAAEAIVDAKNRSNTLLSDLKEYETKYKSPPYSTMVSSTKQRELANLAEEMEKIIPSKENRIK